MHNLAATAEFGHMLDGHVALVPFVILGVIILTMVVVGLMEKGGR